ncbi:hypothetical protein [uncultured Paludibaculum sp.]|uniref:hypothetical protein n=1 Tax=uncultured Paludibaculum sp. TaxID=1765020 RepID=UPI002AAA9252|nr:hypothetical protein [uncultured Paludibaculum sp.]
MTIQCPNCSSCAVQPSSYKSLAERALTLLFLHPFRCRHCTHRFFELVTRSERRALLRNRLAAKTEQAFAVLHSEF